MPSDPNLITALQLDLLRAMAQGRRLRNDLTDGYLIDDLSKGVVGAEYVNPRTVAGLAARDLIKPDHEPFWTLTDKGIETLLEKRKLR
jgi:hypothetical protein